jgi:hypothetical protein
MHVRSETYIRICSDSQEIQKALQAAQTTSPSVWQYQRTLKDTSTHHSVGLFWVPRHSGICGNETVNELTREGSVHQFVGLEPAMEVSRQNIKKKINHWIGNNHTAMWEGLTSTQRQAWELILGLVLLPRLSYCSLVVFNPGLLLTFSLDTTPWKDIATLYGWQSLM